MTDPALKKTPFHDIHVKLGAKMVPFAGFHMPVQYPTGITAEHMAVRQRCGLFDVSHMGEFEIRGADAVEFVNYVTTNNVAGLTNGQVHYSTICNERGTIEDDCLVYRFADKLMMVVNASNRQKDLDHIRKHARNPQSAARSAVSAVRSPQSAVEIDDVSDDIALLALQGPLAQQVLQPLTKTDLDRIKYYHFAEGEVAGVKCTISRTGYTGEDGFELYFRNAGAAKLWDSLTTDDRVTPCGLGARDSLRLEMGMALYGNDIDDTTTPLEANLGWLVKLEKGDFVGRGALKRQKEEGLKRKLAGFIAAERAIPRHGYPVWHEGAKHGEVRSGTMSPMLGQGIGTCYLPPAAAKEGTRIEIEIRGKKVPCTVSRMPFWKQGSHK